MRLKNQGPKFDLAEVKRLAQDYLDGKKSSDSGAAIRFNAPSKSTESVVTVLLCSTETANQKIATGILKLSDNDFFSRTLQWNDVYDVFGLENYEGHNWYIKYCIVSEEDGAEYLEEVSFHPLTGEMILSDGRVLPVTYQPKGWR